jgi:hypothetical protein
MHDLAFACPGDRIREALDRLLFQVRLEQSLKHTRLQKGTAALLTGWLRHADGRPAPLGALAPQVRGQLREHDTFAAIGEDKFLILLAADWDGAGRLARDIIRLVETEAAALRVEIGIALHPADGATSHQLLHCAELARAAARVSDASVYRYYSPEIEPRAAQ